MRLTENRKVRFIGFSQRNATEKYIADIYEKLMKLENIEEKYDMDLLDFLTNNLVVINELTNYKAHKEQSRNYTNDLESILEQERN